MNQEQLTFDDLDERTRKAVHELQNTIAARYPTAAFSLAGDPDDSAGIHLIVVADVDDPDEVGDLVVERVVDLQVEGLPLHVIPLRTPERVQRDLDAGHHRPRSRRSRFLHLLAGSV